MKLQGRFIIIGQIIGAESLKKRKFMNIENLLRDDDGENTSTSFSRGLHEVRPSRMFSALVTVLYVWTKR